MSEEEKMNKTWVIVDENKINWSYFDEDLSDEVMSRKTTKWCYNLMNETKEYFAKFYGQTAGQNSSR